MKLTACPIRGDRLASKKLDCNFNVQYVGQSVYFLVAKMQC